MSEMQPAGLKIARTISVVVPCHNEAQSLRAFMKAVKGIFEHMPDYALELVFVNDGSTDDTLAAMLECQESDSRIVIIDLSRNFGKEAALTAGLDYAAGDAVIPMDADLQDPPEALPLLLEKWRQGYDVVLAHRNDRTSDTWLKRSSARLFYKLHNLFSELPLPENVGDFRLIDRKVVDALKLLPERCRFMKGLFAWPGFRTTIIEYARQPRMAGKTNFKPWKLWNLALDAITGFSTVPLRIWTYIGAFFAFVSFIYATIIFSRTIFFGTNLPGYASMLVAITFLGGLQLIGIGIIGEYLGRAYLETKKRPIYLIRDIYKKDGLGSQPNDSPADRHLMSPNNR